LVKYKTDIIYNTGMGSTEAAIIKDLDEKVKSFLKRKSKKEQKKAAEEDKKRKADSDTEYTKACVVEGCLNNLHV
jgi:hypothetical protein